MKLLPSPKLRRKLHAARARLVERVRRGQPALDRRRSEAGCPAPGNRPRVSYRMMALETADMAAARA